MKIKILVFVFIGFVVGFCIYFSAFQKPHVLSRVDDDKSYAIQQLTIPDIRFQAMGMNRKIEISSLDFDVAMLNFWATWCAPCLKEMPELVKKASLSSRETGAKIMLLAISTDENVEDVEKYIKKLALAHPELDIEKNVYWIHDKDKSISLQKFNVLRVPETIIVNRQLQVLQKVVGEVNWDNLKEKLSFFKYGEITSK